MRPKPAGPSSARHHLVGDKQHTMTLRHLEKRAEHLRTVHAHAARALHERLDDHRRHLIFAPLERLIQPFRGKRHDIRAKEERLESAEEHGIAADRHRSEGIAVIAALEADEARSLILTLMAPILIGHLERHLHRRAAVVGVKDSSALPRDRAQEELRQLDGGGMGDPGEMHVIERCSGLMKRSQENRVTMSVQDRPPRRNAVNDLAAIGQEKILVLSADADQRRVRIAE